MRSARRFLTIALLSAVGAGCRASSDDSRQDVATDAIAAPILADTAVDVPPRPTASRDIAYPDSLRHAGVEGRVVVAGVVDVDGTVDSASVIVLTSTDAGFEASATEWMRGATFTPGTVGGDPVRVRIEVPIEFRLSDK